MFDTITPNTTLFCQRAFRLIVLVALVVLFFANIRGMRAQTLANPNGVAAGGTFVTRSSDVDAFGANPALFAPVPRREKSNDEALLFAQDSLSQEKKYAIIFTLGASGIHAGESTFSFADVSRYFGTVGGERRVLRGTDLVEAASRLDGSRVGVLAESVPLALVVQTPLGAFAASYNFTAQAGISLPRGIAHLAQGYDAGENLVIENLRMDVPMARFLAYASIHAGYARYIELSEHDDSTAILVGLNVGGSFQYSMGYSYEEISSTRLHLAPLPVRDFPTTSYNIRLQSSYTTRSSGTALLSNGTFPRDPFAVLAASPVGQGISVSLGGVLSMRLPGSRQPTLKAGLSILNYGAISWNNANTRSFEQTDTITSILMLADSAYIQRFQQARSVREDIATALPALLNVGFSFDYGTYFGLQTPIVVSFQYTQGLNDSGYNTTQPRVGVGLQWENTGFVPSLRTGVSVGGQDNILWSCGLGWNIADACMIDAALTNLLPIIGGGEGVWLGGSVRIKGRIAW